MRALVYKTERIYYKSVEKAQESVNDKMVNVKSSLCLTNYALRHEDVWGSGSIDPRIFDLATS
jgi:hypothetical protein